MRLRLSVLTAMLGCGLLVAPALAAPTSPDAGFGGDGLVVLDAPGASLFLTETEALDDGSLLVLLATSDDPTVEVRKLRPDGALDTTFGGDGVVELGDATPRESLMLAVDPERGHVYAAGLIDGPGLPATLWRLRADGALDPSFGGGDGEVTFPNREINDVVAAGTRVVMVGYDFAADRATAWQITPTGAPDAGFGTGGQVALAPDPDTTADTVLRQDDGRLVVAGSAYDPTASLLPVWRLTRQGAPDPSFSGDGRTDLDPSSPGVTTSTVWDVGLMMRPDGRLAVAAGLNQNAGGFRNAMLVSGLRADGRPDPKFGSRVLTGISATDGSLALQRDGVLVVGGGVPPSPLSTAAVARFRPNGSLDTSWAGDGIFELPGAGSPALVALLPTGRIVMGTSVGGDVELRALQGTAVPRCKGRLATQFGTAKKDKILGTAGADVLVGLKGKDTIKGKGGKDLICGNGGADKLIGGKGADRILGQGGNDLIKGQQGKDKLFGGPGKNTVKQ